MNKYDSLNPAQKEAMLHTEGPLLILAGAGSGKTRVLTHRIAYLIEEEGVNPWNIMAITFTNKAAAEMRERVDKLVGFGSEAIWVATFHSSCVRILRRHIAPLGYDTNFTIYDADDQKTVVKRILKRLQLDVKLYPERSVLAAISSAKEECMSPDEMELQTGDFRQKQLARIYREYQKELRQNNALDFDDLLLKTVELFEQFPEVLDYYRERFHYIMVDEYQDTNTVQFKFVSLLAGKYRNICVVGDDDQSIYKFRGANITNILGFENVYPDARVIKLEQNYRSSGNILSAANAVIRHNKGRKEKSLWTEKQAGTPVRMRLYDNGYDEAEAVVSDIARAVGEEGASYQDCAVLYRTNSQSRAFEEKCIAMNVPYRIFGGINFYQRQEVKDMLAYLKTVENGRDDLAVRRIINVPKRGIGATTVERIQAYADVHSLSFFEALQAVEAVAGISSRAEKQIHAFVNQILLFRAKLTQGSDLHTPVSALLRDILEQTGYRAELDTLDEETAETKKQNIEELINKAVDFENSLEENGETERSILGAFLEEVALVADIDNLDSGADYVVLMTLHGAKGLEFPRVYMCGMEEGLFPGRMAINSGDPTDLEEERRLCYVGITRAQEVLTLSAAKLRTVRGETCYNCVSRFVEELPQEEIDYRETAGGFGGSRFGGSYSGSVGEKGRFGGGVSDGRNARFDTVFDRKEKPAFSKGFSAWERAESPQAKWRNRGSGTAERQSAYRTAEPPKPAFGRSFEPVKAAALDYCEGDRVRHTKFGEGTVLEIVDGKRDFEVTVAFDQCGQKRMFAGFAKLEKI